ncbi:MAG: hypothetical protein AAF725_14210, partial [Acidobacteriota bacterium]
DPRAAPRAPQRRRSSSAPSRELHRYLWIRRVLDPLTRPVDWQVVFSRCAGTAATPGAFKKPGGVSTGPNVFERVGPISGVARGIPVGQLSPTV